MALATQNYWVWEGAEDYKNERLTYYQDQLFKSGITNMHHLRNFTSQLINENGALDPMIMGDYNKKGGYYCSIGIPQINACVHHNMSATRFVNQNPEWKDWKFQIDIMVEWATSNYEKYNGDIFRAVVHHNCPACAQRNSDSNAGYWAKNLRTSKLLTI